jgi:hypothetical protein
VNNVPGKGELEKFWREIYGKKVQHNKEKGWIKKTIPTTSKRGIEPNM